MTLTRFARERGGDRAPVQRRGTRSAAPAPSRAESIASGRGSPLQARRSRARRERRGQQSLRGGVPVEAGRVSWVGESSSGRASKMCAKSCSAGGSSRPRRRCASTAWASSSITGVSGRRLDGYAVDDRAVVGRVVLVEERLVPHPDEALVGEVAAEEHVDEAQVERADEREHPRAVRGDAAERANAARVGQGADVAADRQPRCAPCGPDRTRRRGAARRSPPGDGEGGRVFRERGQSSASRAAPSRSR